MRLQAGFATAEGTLRYRDMGVKKGMDPSHFRSFLSLSIASLGAGTYLGEADSLTDRLVEEAVYESVASGGINVIDTAINYRMQKAERSIGRTLERLTNEGVVKRDELFIATKNGYLTSDGDLPKDFWRYVQEEYIRTGKLKVDEIAGEVHSMAPRFLLDQLERSLGNLGVECIDLVYLHNAAESWIPEIGYRSFLERVEDVFSLYEKKRREGKLRYYGFASWICFRVPRGEPEHASLDDLVEVAKNVGGAGARFQVHPVALQPGDGRGPLREEPEDSGRAAHDLRGGPKTRIGGLHQRPFRGGPTVEPHQDPRAGGFEGALAPPVRALGSSRRDSASGRAERPGARAREHQDREDSASDRRGVRREVWDASG